MHMQDVQKELHNMRELVGQIADEKTKRAKIQQLKKDQIFYRQEAVRLDSECTYLHPQLFLRIF